MSRKTYSQDQKATIIAEVNRAMKTGLNNKRACIEVGISQGAYKRWTSSEKLNTYNHDTLETKYEALCKTYEQVLQENKTLKRVIGTFDSKTIVEILLKL